MHSNDLVTLCGEQIERPGHICAFFDSREQEYRTLIPYFREGIEAGEIVFNIVDRARETDHVGRLRAAGLPLGSDTFNFATSEDTYLLDDRFDIDRMCDVVREQLVLAQARGKRVRTSGAMDWLKRGAPGSDRAIEYEARMNLLVPAFDCTFMCVYDLANLTGEMVVDILATHHYAIVGGQIRQNAFFVQPDVYLEQILKRNDRKRTTLAGVLTSASNPD
jgi:hypothetical protein